MEDIKKPEEQPVEQPESVLAPAPEPAQPIKPHKTSHTIAAFVILILVAAAIGVGTWYYLTIGQKDSGGQSNLTWKETGSEETKDWKTYKNDKYKYSIKYPKNWVYKDYEQVGGSAMVAFADTEAGLPPEQSDAFAIIDISVISDKINESTLTQSPDKLKKESITVGKDIRGTKYTLLPGRENDMGGDMKEVIIELNESVDGKYLHLVNNGDKFSEIFEKILKTFKLEK